MNPWRQPPVDAAAMTTPMAVSPSASPARDQNAPPPAAPAEAKAMAARIDLSPSAPMAEDAAPAFDVARIEPTGEAVIAGRAAPGATVELLRDGQHHDQAVADQAGQFVMVPTQLPAGKYELTLRSRLPDGTVATSKAGVMVALNEVPPTTGALQSHAEAPLAVPEAAVAKPPAPGAAVAQLPHPSAPVVADGGSAGESKTVTRVVSRGDTLWHISRVTYGVGTRYAIVYRANRDRIRDPDRIYPGQVFVLPMKSR
jgi:nucleoid-associated protein YgaU